MTKENRNPNILIAEMRDVFRTGLLTIFRDHLHVSTVCEAANKYDLQYLLHSKTFDMIYINQSMFLDFIEMPIYNIVLLAENFDDYILKIAYKKGARAYLAVNTSIELLKMTLWMDSDTFLIEPIFGPYVMQYILESKRPPIQDEFLTSREKEIVHLMRDSMNKTDIACQLHITESTLKTHLKNIEKKRKRSPEGPF